MKDPFKDPTQELIDEYANLADSHNQQNTSSNSSKGGNKTAESKQKEDPNHKKQKDDIGPKQETEPSVPEPGKELQDKESNLKKPVGKIKLKPKQ